jgi:hypothetical protein
MNDELREVVRRLNAKWGTGRLPMLADADLRARFRRQVELFNKAHVFADREAIEVQTEGLRRAWLALDAAAEAAGLKPLVPDGPPSNEPPFNWAAGDDVEDLWR